MWLGILFAMYFHEKFFKYICIIIIFIITGDLRLWVYIDDKSSGNCVCVVVKPTMTALEMTQKVLDEKNLRSDFVLHEMVLGGALQRPIHHSEHVLGKNYMP